MGFLIVQVGHTFDSIRTRLGDYDAWFRERMGLQGSSVTGVTTDAKVTTVTPIDGEPLPSPERDWDGIVVTGSAALVTDREAWSEATAGFLREQLERDRPVLGVCYGHQLLADALGGRVGFNPHGRQIGSVEISLTEAGQRDALLGSLPTPHIQQVSHMQSVLEPPPGAELLGVSPGDPHHLLRFQPRAWGVQFHPEFDAGIVRTYIHKRRAAITKEGLDPDALQAGTVDGPYGTALLEAFVALCREAG